MVEALGRVHRRYVGASDAFKSAWTFHQFIQGLCKVFPKTLETTYDADFQGVYGQLKKVSLNLNELGAEVAEAELDTVQVGVDSLNQVLLDADTQIAPTRLRQFFQRVKNYDDEILSQLIKFYLYTQDGQGWPIDRLDKADFLVTKLCQEFDEERERWALRDRSDLRELTEGLWASLRHKPDNVGEVDASVDELQDIRLQLATVDSIDCLDQLGLVQRLRELKHSFGTILFHPRVLTAVVETNLTAKNRVEDMYRREEERIVAEYQQVFDLERDGPHDARLREELDDFRDEVDRFEQQLQGANVRLVELARLRRRVRELVPRMQPGDDTAAILIPPELPNEYVGPDSAPQPATELAPIAIAYKGLLEALEKVDLDLEPKKVITDPQVFSYGLEQREVIAHRRMGGAVPWNRERESLILQAVALRALIAEHVEEIKGILDETAVTRDSLVFTAAREATRLGALFVRRLAHQVEEAMMDGDIAEAQALYLLKMRATRTYAGLWLMIHRP